MCIFCMFYMNTDMYSLCVYICACVYIYNTLMNTNGMVNIWKISFNTKGL